MIIISIIILLIGLGLSFQAYHKIKNINAINTEIDKVNALKQERSDELDQEIQNKLNSIEDIEEQQDKISKQYTYDIHEYKTTLEQIDHDVKNKRQQLEDLQKDVTNTIDNQKKLSQIAFESYCETLVKSYDEKEKEYQDNLSLLQNSYSQEQLRILKELEDIQEANKRQLEQEKVEIAEEVAKEREILNKIRETRTAALQAQLKEKEIEQKLSFYCLQVTDNELKDIAVLESIKPKLNNPRILSMLIWQTYQRTPMTKLCNNIIGKDIKTGIYKITNQKTKECYIGQAVDLASRQKDHAKCGLGIDTPSANKLYKAMQEYGINNFSWEILEECPKDLLDEKEKYYIELYQSKEFGYNIQAGNK